MVFHFFYEKTDRILFDEKGHNIAKNTDFRYLTMRNGFIIIIKLEELMRMIMDRNKVMEWQR